MKSIKLFAPIVLAALLVGCVSPYSNSRLIDLDANTETQPNPPYRAPVVGVLIDSDVRPVLENAIVAQLQARGVNARAAMPIYGHKGIEGKSREYLAKRMRDYGFDSAIAIHLLKKEVENVKVSGAPGNPAPEAAGLTMHPESFSPDFFVKESMYASRADFWDVGQRAIVWSGTIVTVNPKGLEAGTEQFAEVLVNNLMKAGLFEASTQ